MQESLWTYKDVANRLSVSPQTVRVWVMNKNIPYFKIGRLVRFKKEAIESWIERGKQ